MAAQVTIEELAQWLSARDDFVLSGHVAPDGDAAGSCMAAALALQALGKRAFVCLPDPLPEMYRCYPRSNEILSVGDDFPFAPKTAFSLDVSEIQRLGRNLPLFEGCESFAMLDHHDTNPGFGDVWHVEGGRAATGEMVLELVDALGVSLTPEIATWIFVAISSDTGHFRFSSTTRSTMEAGGRLIEAGADVSRIARALWNTRTRARTKLLGIVLSDLEVSEDGKMAWARMTKDMLKRAGAHSEDKEGIVNYLLEIENVEFAALAEERDEGIKFSLRSKEWLDVAVDVAGPFGGGGHSFAAGCTLNTDIEDALAQVLAQARLAIARHDGME